MFDNLLISCDSFNSAGQLSRADFIGVVVVVVITSFFPSGWRYGTNGNSQEFAGLYLSFCLPEQVFALYKPVVPKVFMVQDTVHSSKVLSGHKKAILGIHHI